jgi:hypothetical protein
VASIAFDDYDEPAKPPISLHPAFPGIVALWFSALLGVGSLVLPPVLLEKLLVGSGIASLIPAANPPLGLTARGLIAIAAALAGAAIGVAIARRVARLHEPKQQSRAAKLVSNPLRPLSIKDELSGQKPIKGDSLPINRRRALAISEDDRPSDFLYHAPLPGQDPDRPAPLELGNEPASEDEEPLELCTTVDDVLEPVTATEIESEPATGEEEAMIETQEFQPVSPFQPFEAPEPEPEPEPEPADDIYARKNPLGPRGLEPLPFAAPSLARRAEAEPQVFVMPEPEPKPQVFAASQPVVEAVADSFGEPQACADWESAPLEGLGLVQLVQRLGSTIERRRELRASAPAVIPHAPAQVAPVEFEAAPAEEAAQAMAAYFNSAPEPEQAPETEEAAAGKAFLEEDAADFATPPRPNFLRSLQPLDDLDDEDHAVPDFSLPLRRPAASPAFAAPVDDASEETDDEADEGENEASDAGYSSLLGMKNPFDAPKNEFVRIDEPDEQPELPEPTVTFPGQEKRESFAIPVSVNGSRLFDPPSAGGTPAPASAAPQAAPAEADAALRAALATLQKMSTAG